MGAAGQYKRKILIIQGDCVLDDHFGPGYDCENPYGDDDIETLYDSAISCRDYDLVLAIKLEKSTYSDDRNAVKKKGKVRYQAPRNRIVRAWLNGIKGEIALILAI